jgi:hypothetical protein
MKAPENSGTEYQHKTKSVQGRFCKGLAMYRSAVMQTLNLGKMKD